MSITIYKTDKNTYIKKTKAELDSLVALSGLNMDAVYEITDPATPVKAIQLRAISKYQLDINGTSLQYCPAYYGTGSYNTKNWIGVWRSSKTANIGDLCVWGATVWENITGNIGSSTNEITLNGTNWVQVPVTDTNAYVIKSFNIKFDFANNWISEQSDDKGNINTCLSYVFNIWNPSVFYDWNSDNLYNNKTSIGILNNYSFTVANNIASKIWGNSTYYIYYNILSEEIQNNTNTGEISYNTLGGNIALNGSNVTNISFNSGGANIVENNNLGNINGNFITNSLINNTNTGNISNNTGTKISYNSNNGVIDWNYVTDLFNNSNSGDIFANQCSAIAINLSGATNIQHNIIDEGINGNNNNGTIEYNLVKGIYGNTNDGPITDNENNGYIQNNQNIGTIAYNRNNGGILAIGNSTTDIQYNTNNGSILTTVVGAISDPIVDK